MDAGVNWLWQGCLVALVSAVVLRVLQHASAQARYVVCWAALLAVLGLPLVPLARAGMSLAHVVAIDGPVVDPLLSVPEVWWTSTDTAMAIWALWSAVWAVCVARALSGVRRTRRACGPFPSSIEGSLRTWSRVARQGRRARLVVSDDVRVAAVLGGGWPFIAVAPRLIEQLSAGDLDRIVVHEWAHVQRRDDIAAAIQLAVRVVAGWHPAVWWLDRRLRVECEMACDEMAVRLTGSAKSYAACLVKLADMPSVRRDLLAAPGVISSPALAHRIRRILSHRTEAVSAAWSRYASAASASLLVALGVAVGMVPIVETAIEPRAASQRSGVSDVAVSAAISQPVAPQGPTPASQYSVVDTRRRPAAAAAPPASQGPSPTTEIPADAAPPRTNHIAVDSRPTADVPSLELLPVRRRDVADFKPLPAVPSSIAETVVPPQPGTRSPTPWGAVADAGVAAGQGSKNAGVATAGFFTRLGKRIAGSF